MGGRKLQTEWLKKVLFLPGTLPCTWRASSIPSKLRNRGTRVAGSSGTPMATGLTCFPDKFVDAVVQPVEEIVVQHQVHIAKGATIQTSPSSLQSSICSHSQTSDNGWPGPKSSIFLSLFESLL